IGGLLDSAVRDRYRTAAVSFEMKGGQLRHLARADEQHGSIVERAEDLLRKLYGDIAHRYAAGADIGVAPHLLRQAEAELKEVMQVTAGKALGNRHAVGIFHLPDDLRFTDHHGVEA